MAKWIWVSDEQMPDSYGEFVIPLKHFGKSAKIRISADSDYTLYVNGKVAGCNQYRDFPYCKIYDEIDIGAFLNRGDNLLAVEVWYYGDGNCSYYPGMAGLWYEVFADGTKIAESCEGTLSRLSRAYENGRRKKITWQLGLGFHYDATKDDNWKTLGSGEGFSKSVTVSGLSQPQLRPIERLDVLRRTDAVMIKREKERYLFDLGFEEVGFPTLKISSDVKQTVTLSWGEHIADGWVRRVIGGRDFSVELTVGTGVTEYTNLFRRFGARYLEVSAESPIKTEYIGLLPCVYPLKKIPKDFKSDLRNKIYETAVRTLELCMHDHYEDCPWREQGMYAMDGRNQMLCGYYAFGEYRFPRAALKLMSLDNRADGLLSICTPDKNDLTIPSFSLHYFTAVAEYCEYSHDLTLASEVLPKLRSLIRTFEENSRDGLVTTFPDKCHWNFYEWTDDLDGGKYRGKGRYNEAALCCLLSIAYGKMQKICNMLGISDDFTYQREKLNSKIYEVFYNSENGLFINREGEENYSELVNSLAVLCGAAGDASKNIAKILAGENDLTKTSLSMCCFKYDALLSVDREMYAPYVLADIDRKYKRMLDLGATSFWETEQGERDFNNAGSLCHGWSAMPVYYYNILLQEK